MPVVEIDPEELKTLAGAEDKPDEELKSDLFALGLEFEGRTDNGAFELEFAPDRLDRLSVEGIARSLRYQYGHDRGVYLPSVNDAEWAIEVDESVPDERPYVTGAVVRGVDLDESRLESIIQLQEKLHATMGRERAKGAIGVHDLAMLKGRSASDAGAEGADEPGTDPTGDAPPTSMSTPATSDDPTNGPEKTITYRGVAPDGDRFVPLDDDADRTPAEVLETHPTGDTYGDLVSGFERYPAIYDDIGLFSFPPVINGKRTEVDEGSRDLLIEMTGTDQWTIDRMLAIVCYALDARGGQLEALEVRYGDRTLPRPDLSTETKRLAHEHVETTLGIDLPGADVVDLLERAGLDADATNDPDTEPSQHDASGPDIERVPRRAASPDTAPSDPDDGSGSTDESGLVYEVEIPPYRVDVLHPMDLVDDIGRAYGFNDLDPRYPDVSTVGGRTEASRLEDAARDALVGLGFEDLLNFHLTDETALFERMSLSPDDDALGARTPPRITEPYSEAYTAVRTWALPSLLSVLENNTHRAYPQDLAEIGLVAGVDDDEPTGVAEHRSVAAVVARTDASYEDAKARLSAVARTFGVELETPPTEHPSFVSGRTAAVVLDGAPVGVIGEVHPRVLVEHDLEVPVSAFEFRLEGLGDR
ncbi:phenylalanine--tRNA ligase beta subunit-related protein [Natronomonas sp.]|uniref:phenylalanine--tRNA ligase beta subunit-related protein n=1 Tax=Natronomonas sp. TaxID=2184060 RepID=UPI002638AA5A|nr:phenylalanine--tRNA ligase beta subunit-related protein [Natronomonas sp.]